MSTLLRFPGRGQNITCPTCGRAPCANPSFCAACRAVDRQLAAWRQDRERLRRCWDAATAELNEFTARLEEKHFGQIVRALQELPPATRIEAIAAACDADDWQQLAQLAAHFITAPEPAA
jgi:hypothetical protein